MGRIHYRFGKTPHRQLLLAGLENGLRLFGQAGCKTVFIDGSFVTDKESVFNEQPNDFDVCWNEDGVDIEALLRLEPVFLDFTANRAARKDRFRGEFLPLNAMADHKAVFLDYFQKDKNTGRPKGIVKLNLETLP